VDPETGRAWTVSGPVRYTPIAPDHKTIRYPIQGKRGKTHNVKQRDILRHEAIALANALLGKCDLPTVVESRKLWDDAAGTPAPDADDDPTSPDDPEKPPY
jgi:hypothetical protein